ncbi:MAG: proteasome subunit beta [Conexivisphaera sp.]
MAYEYLIPGATAVGIAFKDGVVLAAEKRFAYGNFIISRSGKKVFRITDGVGAAFAGMIGDMQVLVKYVQSLVKLKEVEELRPVTPRSVAKLMGVILYEQRLTPMLTQVIVGGLGEAPEIYVLDPLGSVIPDRYASVGTGAETAISVIESGYREGLDAESAVDLAVRSIRSAILRDTASGDGADVLIIRGSGAEERSLTF